MDPSRNLTLIEDVSANRKYYVFQYCPWQFLSFYFGLPSWANLLKPPAICWAMNWDREPGHSKCPGAVGGWSGWFGWSLYGRLGLQGTGQSGGLIDGLRFSRWIWPRYQLTDGDDVVEPPAKRKQTTPTVPTVHDFNLNPNRYEVLAKNCTVPQLPRVPESSSLAARTLRFPSCVMSFSSSSSPVWDYRSSPGPLSVPILWSRQNATETPMELSLQTTSLGPGHLLWLAINAFLFVLILGGNILTIVAVRTCRHLRSVISNLFILSLAVSDFCVGLALPYHLVFYMGSDIGGMKGPCLLRFFLLICACCVSMLTLISIAVDRYIAVVYALHYRRYMTRRVAYSIIVCNWCLGALVALMPVFWNRWPEAQACEFDEVLSPGYIAGVITPGFVIIWICMLLVYWRIMREASKQAQRLRQSVVYNTDEATTMRSLLLHPDWKSVQIVVFIMGCFTLCWLPYFCVAIAQLFSICRSSSMIYKATFSLAITNSALNPIIYSWKNSGFRRAFAQTLCCRTARQCEEQLPADSKHRMEATSSSTGYQQEIKPKTTQ